MSIKDITNYVRQTPGNTNPSVIRSMVEGQIGECVEEASNEALRKLGIGTKNAPGVLKVGLEMCQAAVANGSAIEVPDLGTCIRILDRPITQDEIKKVVLNIVGETETHERADLNIASPSSDYYGVVAGGFIALLVANADTDVGVTVPKGTYAVYYNNEYGTSYVVEIHGVLTETITPIKDDYLPMDTITEAAMEKLGIREEKTRVSQVLSITKDLTFDVDEETGIGNVWIDDRGLVLEHGKTYEVVVDGKSYYCQAIDERAWYLLGVFPPSSDCPFYINSDRDTIDLFVKGTETTHTVDIYETVEKTAPISDKYLPEGKVGRSEWEVIFNHTYMFMGGAAIGDLDGDGIADGFPLVVGKRYMITFDGVDYEYTCELMPGESVSYIGSLEFLESGIADGQAPVVFMDTSSLPQPGGTYIVTADKTPTQHTIKVAVEKITPINQKYLPGVCLPVVDLETVIDLGETGLTEVLLSDSDNQKLNSAVSQGAPVPINFTFKHGGNIPCGVMITTNTMFVNGDIIALFADFRMLAMGNTLYHITIANNEGNWSANLGTVKAIEDLM